MNDYRKVSDFEDRPDPINRVMLDKPLELAMTDVQAVSKNVAENGRLFCFLLVFISLVLFLAERDAKFATLAVLSATPVGLSVIVDQTRGRLKIIIGLCMYAFTACLPLAMLAFIG